jgi:hypothetical protein
MSGIPFMLPETPPLMGAARARDLARIYKGFADHVRGLGDVSGANSAERQSQWWLAYSVALSQTPPGAIDER